MVLRLEQISKSFGKTAVLQAVSLTAQPAQLLALLGPSGCGKTTLLRIIAGLEQADTGQVLLGGQDSRVWPLHERGIGFVFQNYALFRHMSVAENIGFGLRVKPRGSRLPRHEQRRRVGELIELMQLDNLGGRYPQELSGGQRQRVALARALATQPRLLLLDEPFGALDAKVRGELRVWLRDLQKRLEITCIMVTHDQEEAALMADHVVLLNSGAVAEEGAPEQIFARPVSDFARSFFTSSRQMTHGHANAGGLL